MRRVGRLGLCAMALAMTCVLLSGCALLPRADMPKRGNVWLHSPGCHCRFSYPASWYFEPANNDASLPLLGLHSYNDSSAAHVPIPASFADVGVDWQSDPLGQLYLAATEPPFGGAHGRHETVSGFVATAFTHWTAPPARGGVYEEHVYFFVPQYQRDYDLSLVTANPPGDDVRSFRAVFERLVRSMVIVPPNVLP